MAALRHLTSEAHNEEDLIPGISNEITLDLVTTKLPWTDIRILLLVSRGWCRAIQTREVYDARVRSQSTETFLLVSKYLEAEKIGSERLKGEDLREYSHATALFSPRDISFRCDLPSIPSDCFDEETPAWGRCQTLDGKVYVFGGLDRKVHVFDVAGQRKWKQCASTQEGSREFGCGVVDGKLVVFGGAVSHESISGNKLHDPADNTWSMFRPIVSFRTGHYVTEVRKDLFEEKRGEYLFYSLSGGYLLFTPSAAPRVCFKYQKMPLLCAKVPDLLDHARYGDLLQVYDPIKDEWRVVKPVGSPQENLFIARGKFYSMSPHCLHAYDFPGNSWAHMHSFSFPAGASVDCVELWPLGIFSDDNELLAVSEWRNAVEGTGGSYLVQSRGLGNLSKELLWPEAEFPTPFDDSSPPTTAHLLGRNTLQL